MLPENKRTELDAIVQDMANKKESDFNIRFVVDDFKKKYDVPEQISQPQESGFLKKALVEAPIKIGEVGTEFFKGVGKGALSTIQGLSTIGQKAQQVIGLQREPIVELPKSLTEAEGTAQKFGKGLEQVAEFFIPATKAAKAEKFVNVLSQSIKSPVAAALTRIGGKAAVQATTAGGVRLAQTGGDIKEAEKAAITAGVARGALATTGEVARAFKIPERLYNVIFKNSKNDMFTELNSDALKDLSQKNPAQFQDWVEKGIIRLKEGQPILNDTLAEDALHRGLRGSFKNMANEVIQKSFKAEDDVQTLLADYKGTVDVSEKQFTNVLKNIAEDYQDVGFGEVAEQATKLADEITAGAGKVNAKTALELRRLLDRMRIASSYDKPVTKLSMTQANFKTLADSMRSRLAKIPGVASIMKDYSFYIDALDDIAQEAAKRGNSQVLGMIDSLFLGGAAVSNNPTSLLTIGLLRRMVQSPTALTNLAQTIQKSTASPLTSGLLGVGSAGISSEASPQ